MYDYHCNEPGQLVRQPGEQLEKLYGICFGHQWRSTAFDLLIDHPSQSLDLFTAIVGAAIYSEVFQAPPLKEAKIVVSFDSSRSESKMIDALQKHGKARHM
jgi:hypothetical protein